MKYWHLVWSSMRRKRLRTIFTLLSIVVAFILYGYLAAIDQAFGMGVELAGADRLVLMSKVSLIQLLPQSYQGQIAAVPHVVEATHATWFGGIYQDPKNFFGQLPVEPEAYLRMYPELIVPEAQKKAWFEDRTGALVGRTLATKFGWKVGDRVPIQATIWRKKDNSSTWEFTIDGIYDGNKEGVDTTQFLFHYKYFDEARWRGAGPVGWYIIRIDAPDDAPKIAAAIDKLFENSAFETKTSTEKAFMQGFAKQVGNIGAIIEAVLIAVFFTMLLVVGNTMMQSVRERTTELAVLKTIGFTDVRVLALVLAQSLLVAVVGGVLGLALGWLMIRRGDPTGGALPIFFFPPRQMVWGLALVAALGLITGIIPAVQAMRLRVVDALRRT
jgi:putative ABC transport system permease protein